MRYVGDLEGTLVVEQPSTVQPELNKAAYHCPFCEVYATQKWFELYYHVGNSVHGMPELKSSLCAHCHKFAVWYGSRMIHPDTIVISPPNPDLDSDIQKDYKEAASIVTKSPRAAAAILRLCVQKLCRQLGQNGRKINDDIAALVKNGLAVEIQQALDVLRVVGNNAVHPGQIDLTDDEELASRLFHLLNLIADNQITQPKRIRAMFEGLPQRDRENIRKRDGKS